MDGLALYKRSSLGLIIVVIIILVLTIRFISYDIKHGTDSKNRSGAFDD